MKKFFALLLILTACFCFGQNTYQPGYFISNNGMKTDCLIRNIGWKNSPTSFTYKNTESDEAKELTITEVKEFAVNEAYKFRRYEVNVDRSATTVDKLSTRREPEWSRETIFLKVLVEGTHNLMEYEDNNFRKFFYSTGDHSSAEQLFYKEYVNLGVIHENSQFRQQLFNLMKDKFSDTKRVAKLVYKKDPLVKLFLEYNGSEGTNFTARQNKGKLNLRVTAEARFASMEVSNDLMTFKSYDTDRKLTFVPGLELEYVLPFNNNKWAIFINPSYQSYSTSATAGTGSHVDVKYSSVDLPMGARHYFYLNASSSIYVQAAYVLAVNVGERYVNFNAMHLDLGNGTNFAAGAGFSYKNVNAGVNLNLGRGLSEHHYWGISYHSFGIVAGYKFL